MKFLSGFWDSVDKILDKILHPKDDVLIGHPRYDNMLKIIDKKSRIKASNLLTETMGGEVEKIDRNKLYREISTIIEFYRFLYGVGGNVMVDNLLSGFNFKFACNSSEFLEPLYKELGRIFGYLDISIQYSDNISFQSNETLGWLSVMLLDER